MKTISFTGICPQCELYEEIYDMMYNDKHWECPSCSLLVHEEQGKALIFKHRGTNEFSFKHQEFKSNLKFSEVDEYSYSNDADILTKPHLIEYLLKEVAQKPYYSIDNLIDTYANYKLGIGSENLYTQQAVHFNIDFEDESIIELLKQRDKLKNYSFQYETERLYHFMLDIVFPKYISNDISWLPEMGMSELQFHLCKKNIPDNNREMIIANPMYSKQVLKALLKDLISIIYFDKTVFLTGDLKLAEQIKKDMFNHSNN